MNLNMLSENEDIIIFQDMDTNKVYIVEQTWGADEPMEMVDDNFLFVGCYGDFQYSKNLVFKTLGDYIAMHGEVPNNADEFASLFKGELCSHFKCVGWDRYGFVESYNQVFAVDKRLGDAEQWLNYCIMNDEGQVYSVLDASAGTRVTDIYANCAEDALELYLKEGELASLKAQVDKAMKGV